MTKLERVMERIRQLPPEEQEALAAEIEFRLDEGVEPALSAEQEAELDRRLSDPSRTYVSHEEVRAYLEKKHGS